MRGELGVGINRINDYTIKRAALGLARYVQKAHAEQQGVVISLIIDMVLNDLRNGPLAY
ncbi:hypothetical protein ODV97_08875 [Enterococcus gallinarum]|nr:hypothetical protein [Enterococcus gallinarum]